MKKTKLFLLFAFFYFFFFESFCQSGLVIEIDGKKQSSKQKIILNAGFHEIIFHFPSHKSPNISYQFRLENIENQWKTTTYPAIRYINLAGGKYVFYGKVVENQKIISQFSNEIEIKQNFWEKWWFWIFAVFFSILFVSLIVYFWFLYDFRQRMKTEQIRQRIAADLHDEVGANLSSIAFLVESLKRKVNRNDEKIQFLLEKIAKNSLESADLINDTIWALNPAFDTFDKLIERIKSFASGLLSANDIAFSIENNLENSAFELSIEQRRNLYFVLKEAINNAAKHASASKVFLKIWKAENGLKICIEDNGVGFETTKIYEGNGLQNYKNRANQSEIEVYVVSVIGVGTKIEISVSTKNH